MAAQLPPITQSSAENSILPYGFYANMDKTDIDALVAFLQTAKSAVTVVK